MRRDGWSMLAIVAFASMAKLMRYLPAWGLLLFLAGFVALMVLLRRNLPRLLSERPDDRRTHAWVVATLLALAALFLFGHPVVEAFVQERAGTGSDRDEALEAAARAFIGSGRPYDVQLSTGNPVSPMPGELLLALPFVLAGVSGLQNVAWLAFYYRALEGELRSARAAALALWGMVLLAPGVVHEIVSAGDLLATSLYVATGCMLLMRAARRSWGPGWILALGVLFGVTLSSRMTYVLLVPLVFAALIRIRGIGSAVVASIGVIIGFVSVTMPFVLSASGPFAPLHIFEKVNGASELPYASMLVCGLSCLHSAVAAWLILKGGARWLFSQATYVLMTPVALTVVISAPKLGVVAIELFGLYALWCVPFAAAGLARYAVTMPRLARLASVHRARCHRRHPG